MYGKNLNKTKILTYKTRLRYKSKLTETRRKLFLPYTQLALEK